MHKYTDEGFLLVEAVLASNSILDYPTENGNERVLMTSDAIQEAIESFVGLPITNDHPNSGLVTPRNFKDLSVGYVTSDIRYEDGLLKGVLAICEQEAIDAVKGGKTDVSLGYKRQDNAESGVWVDEFGTMGKIGDSYAFDKKRVAMNLNHLALCEVGRSQAAELILDSSALTVTLDSHSFSEIQQTPPNMEFKTVIVNDQEFNIATDSMANFKKMIGEHDAMTAKYDKMCADMMAEQDKCKDALDSLAIANDSLAGLKTALEAAKKEDVVTDSADQVATEVNSRLSAWAEIGGVTNDSVPFDAKLNSVEIKRSFLKSKFPDMPVLDSASPAFLDGLFFGIDKPTKASQVINQVKTTVTDSAPVSKSKVSVSKDGSYGLSIFNR